MSGQAPLSVEARLARLERRDRVQQCVILVLLVGLTVVLVGQRGAAYAQGVRKVLEANALRIVDDKGNTRALLAEQKGAVALKLFDKKQRARLNFVLNDSKPGLVVLDEAGRSQVTLGLKGGQPFVGLSDSSGAPRVGMTMNKDEPMLLLLDGQSQPKAALTTPGGSPTLLLFGAEGKARSVLGVKKQGGYLIFRDAERTRLGLGLDDKGEPELRMLDKTGKAVFEKP